MSRKIKMLYETKNEDIGWRSIEKAGYPTLGNQTEDGWLSIQCEIRNANGVSAKAFWDCDAWCTNCNFDWMTFGEVVEWRYQLKPTPDKAEVDDATA